MITVKCKSSKSTIFCTFKMETTVGTTHVTRLSYFEPYIEQKFKNTQ